MQIEIDFGRPKIAFPNTSSSIFISPKKWNRQSISILNEKSPIV